MSISMSFKDVESIYIDMDPSEKSTKVISQYFLYKGGKYCLIRYAQATIQYLISILISIVCLT